MRFARVGEAAVSAVALGLFSIAAPAAATVASPPLFDKAFSPDTIGPGSTSMLTFTIDNSSSVYPVDLMAFSDEFPFGMALAQPAFVSNTCGGTLELDDGDVDSDFDVRLTDGMVAAFGTCTIVVNAIGTTDCGGLGPTEFGVAVECANTTGTLTSDAGSSGTASASLFVETGFPGFSKSFAPNPVEFTGRSTLTFLIDNSANPAAETFLGFTDTLPAGMVIASPANASTTCGTPPTVTPTLTATAGSDVISFSVFGGTGMFPAVAAGSTCTVEVDVVGQAVGDLGNVSGNLEVADDDFVGKATAVLEVTGFATLLQITKEFLDDPVPPGGVVNLEFKITNKSRDDAATGITFSDTIDPLGALSPGLTPAEPLPKAACGGTLSFAGGVLTLSGGSLAAEATCTFSVALSVPLGATPGSYANTTTAVSGDVGGSPETGNIAGDLLFIDDFPVLTKEFIDDPVGAGGSVTLEFTILNTNSGSALMDIAFDDDLNTAIPTNDEGEPGLAANGLVDGDTDDPMLDVCGMGSKLTVFNPPDIMIGMIIIVTPPDPSILEFSGGSLAEAGMTGDSCTFSVVLDVRKGVPGGTYTNTSDEVTGEFTGPEPTTGPPASGDLIVVGAPTLGKSFADDPVAPGGSVTLEFNLAHSDGATGDATSIAFTDDLTTLSPAVAGLTATAVGPNTCTGSTVDITTDPTLIDFSGGTLMPGEECSFSVTLSVPGGATPGLKTNTSSTLTALVDGLATESSPAEDKVLISGFRLRKEFTDDPVIAGDTATLKFTLDNTSGSLDVTGIAFDDDLDGVIPGMVPAVAPPAAPCGGTLTVSGGSKLEFSGGSVLAGASCDFDVTVTVPTMFDPPGPLPPIPTPDDFYFNATEDESATLDGPIFIVPDSATDSLEVISTLLEMDKEFTTDPVAPGGTVTLELTITNLSATETVTDIEFEDDLDAALPGLEATAPLVNTCGGMATSAFPTGLFTYAGGTLMPGASCMISLTVSVPDAPLGSAPPFINSTDDLAGKVGLLDVFGEPDSDELLVQLLAISKEFTDDPTTAGGTVTLEFTLTNLGPDPVSDLAFTDDLSAVIPGLVATTLPPVGICGAGSGLTGTSFLTFTGGSLAGGAFCVIPVTLTVPASATDGIFLNKTSGLRENGVPVAPAASALLEIEPPPAFSKEFAPDAVLIDQISTLTFTIDNSASVVAASSLDFTDILPAGLEVAPVPNSITDCSGGVITAMAGTTVISYSGGSVAAGATCTVSVDVIATGGGALVNVSGDLTSSSGNSGTASDTITVTVPATDVGLAKTDLSDPVMVNGTQNYKLTVSNLGAGAAQGVELVDALPPGTLFVQASAGCTHTAGVVTCQLGSLATGTSQTVWIQVFVLPTAVSPIENMATVSTLSSDADAGNNDVMISTEVLPFETFVVVDDVTGNGVEDLAYPIVGADSKLQIRDVDTKLQLFQAPPVLFASNRTLVAFDRVPDLDGDGIPEIVAAGRSNATGNHVVRVLEAEDGQVISAFSLPAGLLLTDLEVIDDDGFGDTLLAIGTHRFSDGVNQVVIRRASDGANLGPLVHNAAFLPIDIVDVPSFFGGLGPEVATLGVRPSNGVERVFVRELSGALVSSLSLPGTLDPVGMQSVPDFADMPAPELAVLGFDRTLNRPRVFTIDADSGSTVGDTSGFAAGGAPAPKGLAVMPDFDAFPAPELAVLHRNSAGRTVVRVRDAFDGSQLFVGAFGSAMGAVPLGIGTLPDLFDSPAPELAVYTKDLVSGQRAITIRDAGTGATVRYILLP